MKKKQNNKQKIFIALNYIFAFIIFLIIAYYSLELSDIQSMGINPSYSILLLFISIVILMMYLRYSNAFIKKENIKKIDIINGIKQDVQFISIFFFILLIIIIHVAYPKQNKYVTIDVSHLIPQDQDRALDIINQVKPIFLKSQKEIKFTYSVSDNCLIKQTCYDVLGKNTIGYIIMNFNDDIIKNKKILCHEMSHRFFQWDAISHRLIYVLRDDYQMCYMEKENKYNERFLKIKR